MCMHGLKLFIMMFLVPYIAYTITFSFPKLLCVMGGGFWGNWCIAVLEYYMGMYILLTVRDYQEHS